MSYNYSRPPAHYGQQQQSQFSSGAFRRDRYDRSTCQYCQPSCPYSAAACPYGHSVNRSCLSSVYQSRVSQYQRAPDLDAILARLLNCRKTKNPYCSLSANECLHVARKGMELFINELFLAEFSVPCTIVGDLHGQFIDFLRLLSVSGYPPDVAYVFLGDYVDRGPNAIEVLMTLFIYKIKYPKKVLLLRGNHECPRINAVYGFLTECTMRFGFPVYKAFNDSFAYMPCAAIVSNRIFCCHGGIIRDLETLDQITTWNPRPIFDPEVESTVTELLWSDPDRYYDGWQPNFRGAGYAFGPTPLNEFLYRFNLDLLARAHEVMQDGYELIFDRKAVTIFSAPNYCDQFDNAAAVMNVSKDYLCSFTIIRPISYDFPTTQVVERGGPELTRSPVNEPTVNPLSETPCKEPWDVHVERSEVATVKPPPKSVKKEKKHREKDRKPKHEKSRRCCVLFEILYCLVAFLLCDRTIVLISKLILLSLFAKVG